MQAISPTRAFWLGALAGIAPEELLRLRGQARPMPKTVGEAWQRDLDALHGDAMRAEARLKEKHPELTKA